MAGGVSRLITAEVVLEAHRSGRSLARDSSTRITDEARDLAARLGVAIGSPAPELPGEAPVRGGDTRVQVVIGSDHGGYELKSALKIVLTKAGYTLKDVGCQGAAAVDYPDFAREVASCVARGDAARGVMIDTIGVASAMVCNRVAGCRAAACESMTSALSSRRHNNANILTLGASLHTVEQAAAMLLAWLGEAYEGGRHQRRVDKIMALDSRTRPR